MLPRRALALGRAELPADVVLAHADAAGGPVDVLPAQREQLALAQTGHRGGEEDRAVERVELARAGVLDERVDLVEREETDLVGLRGGGQVDARAGVGGRPPAPRRLGEVEQRRERRDHVSNRLGLEILVLEHEYEVDDVVWRDRVDRAIAEERHEVHARLALDVLDRRPLAALAFGMQAVAAADLVDAQALADAWLDLCLRNQAAQLGLGLRAGETVATAVDALEADLALDLPAVGAPVAVPRLPPVLVGPEVERAGAVGPSSRHSSDHNPTGRHHRCARASAAAAPTERHGPRRLASHHVRSSSPSNRT